ncbi:MAG: hypothetical protein ACM3JB_24460 [Acidobacteriaceae bacterium]
MKRIGILLIIYGVALLCSLSARAQTIEHPVEVTVPFTFYVAQTQFAPGTYRFTEANSVLRVRNERGDVQRMFLSMSIIGKHDQHKLLEFTEKNGKRYLTKVWDRGEEQGRELRVR